MLQYALGLPEAVDNNQASPRLEEAYPFPDRFFRIGQGPQDVPGGDAIEGVVVERQTLNIASRIFRVFRNSAVFWRATSNIFALKSTPVT